MALLRICASWRTESRTQRVNWNTSARCTTSRAFDSEDALGQARAALTHTVGLRPSGSQLLQLRTRLQPLVKSDQRHRACERQPPILPTRMVPPQRGALRDVERAHEITELTRAAAASHTYFESLDLNDAVREGCTV
jgi:hypothetical protein